MSIIHLEGGTGHPLCNTSQDYGLLGESIAPGSVVDHLTRNELTKNIEEVTCAACLRIHMEARIAKLDGKGLKGTSPSRMEVDVAHLKSQMQEILRMLHGTGYFSPDATSVNSLVNDDSGQCQVTRSYYLAATPPYYLIEGRELLLSQDKDDLNKWVIQALGAHEVQERYKGCSQVGQVNSSPPTSLEATVWDHL